ncbi:NAD(P)-dependent oxidoreductase [Sporosarcina sp. YIM B06819]|uniref:NAD(P)-dependent oxidoreductase n=1 Tax=Sporosarcina sp. YIM B06819 TaxID=3081769 RepID=UPI00298D15A6|nr:NAD(P)-dependent oxidoreductase [Sporosarcina sp. YIM B06819]
MKDNQWLVIGTDQRLATCCAMLTERGYSCHHFATNEYTEQLGECIAHLSPKHIVFPILQMTGTIPPALLAEGTRLYTGVASEEWRKPFEDAGLKVHSYVKDEPFIWYNARLTAEAFVHEYYARVKRQLAGNQFHVAGFGKVGKTTAHALAALGADVTVVARSVTQLSEAAVLGYKTERLTADFDITTGNLVNTIPAKWLAVTGNPELHIFDLASAPGCLKEPLSPEYYTVLLGLPGKHFPIDAAAVLTDTVEGMSRE